MPARPRTGGIASGRSTDQATSADGVGIGRRPRRGVLGIEIAGGFEAAGAFLGQLRYARRSASLGGVESLAVHPAAMQRGSGNSASHGLGASGGA